MRNLRYLLLCFGVGFFMLLTPILVSPTTAHATPADSVFINATPENPDPNQSTTISLNSYLYDLDAASISWVVGGKTASSGIGKKSFVLNAPTAGSEINVTAKITLPDSTVEKTILIRSSTALTLLWQADDSYVPPFYRGKALPSPSSEIKIIAMPEIKNGSGLVDPQKMVYAWQKDYTNDPDGSGYGKNYYIYTSDYLSDSNTIDVKASTTDQKYSLSAGIEVPSVNPKIDFYINDPNLGILWNNALVDGYKIQGNQIIQAVPYFVSPKDLSNPILLWNWYINNATVGIVDSDPSILPLAAKEGVSGTSKIRLDLSNWDKVFENVSKEINVSF